MDVATHVDVLLERPVPNTLACGLAAAHPVDMPPRVFSSHQGVVLLLRTEDAAVG